MGTQNIIDKLKSKHNELILEVNNKSPWNEVNTKYFSDFLNKELNNLNKKEISNDSKVYFLKKNLNEIIKFWRKIQRGECLFMANVLSAEFDIILNPPDRLKPVKSANSIKLNI